MPNMSNKQKAPVSIKQGPSPIQNFQQEMNRLFQNFFGETLPHWWHTSESYMPFGACPAVDVIEADKEYKITAELPGLDVKDLNVTVSDGYVTVKGEKKEEEKEEKNGYFRQERSYGMFQRVVALPPGMVDLDKADANMSNGVLTISVPKKAGVHTKTRQIDIKQAAA